MTYEEALEESRRVGFGQATDEAHLASTIAALAMGHAIVPALVYDGARKLGLDAHQVRKLNPATLGDLMFVG